MKGARPPAGLDEAMKVRSGPTPQQIARNQKENTGKVEPRQKWKRKSTNAAPLGSRDMNEEPSYRVAKESATAKTSHTLILWKSHFVWVRR